MTSFYINFQAIGSKLYLRRVDNGITSNEIKSLTPYCFVETANGSDAVGIHGEQLKRMDFSSMWDIKDFVKSYEGKLFGYNRHEYLKINEMFPGEIQYNPSQVNVAFLDIETSVDSGGFPNVQTANEEVLLITLIHNNQPYTFTTRPTNFKGSKILLFKDEHDLLKAFVGLIKTLNIHIITGWNVINFDMAYLYARILRICGEATLKRLSPFGIASIEETNVSGRTQFVPTFVGLVILDYLELYQKFELSPRESYKLDYISKVELNERKLEMDCSFKESYQPDRWDKFVEYNVQDTWLVQRLDNKLQFILLAMSIGYAAKCNYEDVYRVTRVWDNIIALHLMQTDVQVDYNPSHSGDGFEGAFVKETIPGFYQWLASFDVESLYPSLLIQYNISPDKMLNPREFVKLTPHDINTQSDKYKVAISKAKSLNATLCANGAMFSKAGQGFIPYLADKFFQKRKSAKSEMKDWQKKLQAAKVEKARRLG